MSSVVVSAGTPTIHLNYDYADGAVYVYREVDVDVHVEYVSVKRRY
jgi:hypothetical protein